MKKNCKSAMSLLVTLALLVTSVGMLGASAAETQLKVLPPINPLNANFDNLEIGDSSKKSYVAYEQPGATAGNKVMVLADGGDWGIQYVHLDDAKLQKVSAKIKFPSVTGTLQAIYAPEYSNIKKDHSAVTIKNGGVYTRNALADIDDLTQQPLPYENFIPDGTLQADKWYRIERFFNYTQVGYVMHKVFLYDESNNTLVGCTPDWWIAGSYRGNPSAIGDMNYNFLANGFSGNVMLDDFYQTSIQKNENLISSKIDDTPDMYLSVRACELYYAAKGWGKEFNYIDNSPFMSNKHKYSIRTRIHDSHFYPNNPVMLFGTYGSDKSPNSFTTNSTAVCKTNNLANDLVLIDNGKVFVRKPINVDANGVPASYDVVAVKELNPYITLNVKADKWYRFEVDYTHDDTDAIKDSIVLRIYNQDEVLVANTSKIESLDMRKTGKMSVGYFRLPCGRNYGDFDDIKFQTQNSDQSWNTIVDENFNAYENLFDYYKAPPVGTITSGLSTAYSLVKNGEIYIETGTLNGIIPPDVTISSPYYLDESTLANSVELLISTEFGNVMAPPNLVKTTLGADGKSAVISLGTLSYNTKYILRISSKLRLGKTRRSDGTIIEGDYVGFPVLGAVYKDYVFKTVANADGKFEVTQTRFLDEKGNVSSGLINKDSKIKAEATFKNTNIPNRNYLIICAIYKNGNLVNAIAKESKAPIGLSTDNTDFITIPENGCTAKIMVFDGWVQMNQLLPIPPTLP